MSSPMVAVLCIALIVLCVGVGVRSNPLALPEIVDSVKMSIVSKQEDDGKWANEVKLEHGSELAPWKVEVERKTLARDGRQTVELTATLTGPKPVPKACAGPICQENFQFISGLRIHPGNDYFSNQQRDQPPVRSGNFWFPNHDNHVNEPVGPPISGGFGTLNRGQHIDEPARQIIYAPGGVPYPNRFQHINEPTGPQIPEGFGIYKHGPHISEPTEQGIYVPGSLQYPSRIQNVDVPGGFNGIRYTTSWKGSRYFLYDNHMDWMSANKSCADSGSHLAVINSEEESLFLARILSQHFNAGRGAFIGINDLSEEGNWVTTEGVPITTAGFSRWFRSDQPDNENGNENCGSIIPMNGGLNDIPCTNYPLHTICEKENEPWPINGPMEETFAEDVHKNGIEESDSVSGEDNSVHEPLGDDELKTPLDTTARYFQTDGNYGEQLSEDLDQLEEEGEEEESEIQQKLEDYDPENGSPTETYFQPDGIDLDQPSEDVEEKINVEQEDVESEALMEGNDGDQLSEDIVKEKEDNTKQDEQEEEDYTYSDYSWETFMKSFQGHDSSDPVNNFDKSMSEKQEQQENGIPGIDYSQLWGSVSLYKVHSTQMDWETANKTCVEEGAHLAVINSEAEARRLAVLLNKFYDNSHRGAFVGITDKAKEGIWRTVFGETTSEAGYGHWYSNGQRDDNGINNCGAISPEMSCLIRVPCTGYLLHSICEKEADA